jgi:hypothetical protein
LAILTPTVEEDAPMKLDIELDFKPSWMTWAAATSACLNALGVKCDKTDVAGFTGWAFHVAVHPELCPSAPGMFDWSELSAGIRMMGRSTIEYWSGECHVGPARADRLTGGTHGEEGQKNERTRAHCKEAFESAKREIEAGRPSVVWGAYFPEWAVCYGIEEESYLVKSAMGWMGKEEPPVRYDEVDAPGGPYTLGFPTPTALDPIHADHHAVNKAHDMLNRRWPPYVYGPNAFKAWSLALEKGQAEAFGNSFNAAFYQESHGLAAEFLSRLAARRPGAREALEPAAEEYSGIAEALKILTELFPFPGEAGTRVTDTDRVKKAQGALKIAADRLEKARGFLESIPASSIA